MSVDAIKEELTKLTATEQESVSEFLYALRVSQDEELRGELTRRLDNTDAGYWIPADEAFRRLEENDSNEDPA